MLLGAVDGMCLLRPGAKASDGEGIRPRHCRAAGGERPELWQRHGWRYGEALHRVAFQALQLANAVATLAGRGGDGISSKLRQGFGLDNLDVQTTDDGNTQLTAGKYLSEKLYTEVTVDQGGKTRIDLNLDLTDTLTVKGRAGNDGNTGIGLFFEKDY